MLALANTSEDDIFYPHVGCFNTTFCNCFPFAGICLTNLLEELKNVDESEMCVKKLQIIDFISNFNTVSFKLVHEALSLVCSTLSYSFYAIGEAHNGGGCCVPSNCTIFSDMQYHLVVLASTCLDFVDPA